MIERFIRELEAELRARHEAFATHARDCEAHGEADAAASHWAHASTLEILACAVNAAGRRATSRPGPEILANRDRGAPTRPDDEERELRMVRAAAEARAALRVDEAMRVLGVEGDRTFAGVLGKLRRRAGVMFIAGDDGASITAANITPDDAVELAIILLGWAKRRGKL